MTYLNFLEVYCLDFLEVWGHTQAECSSHDQVAAQARNYYIYLRFHVLHSFVLSALPSQGKHQIYSR